MRKIKWTRVFFLVAFSIVFLFASFGCGRYYIHPTFRTKYTVKEHIERIRKRTEERYAKDLATGELKEFFVDIVYAFYDDDPEYYLVEFTFSTPRGRKNSEYAHFIGYIEDDAYMIGLNPYGGYHEFEYEEKYAQGDLYAMCAGVRSAYALEGELHSKKYYGNGVQAVLRGEEKWKVYEGRVPMTESEELERELHPFRSTIVHPSREKDLMENNYKWHSFVY